MGGILWICDANEWREEGKEKEKEKEEGMGWDGMKRR